MRVAASLGPAPGDDDALGPAPGGEDEKTGTAPKTAAEDGVTKQGTARGALDGPVIPVTALASGGTGVRLPLYLGRGPGGTGGVFKPSTKMRGGERERSAGGGVPGIGGSGGEGLKSPKLVQEI